MNVEPFAIISDIHGNLDALQVVLADIDERLGKDATVVCLGDIVGYGPEPGPCLDLVAARCDWCLMGNHDYGVLYEPTNFNKGAESAAYWTRESLMQEPDEAKRSARWQFIDRLLIRKQLPNKGLAVHGSPRRPINEYILAKDPISLPSKMDLLFKRIEHWCLVGHTHVQGVFTTEPDFQSAEVLEYGYQIAEGQKAIVNVGSVGQPRDRDPRSAYTILDGSEVTFVRLAYDIDAVMAKVEAIDALADFFGKRLYEGR